MTVTVKEFFVRIARDLHEPVEFSGGIWTSDEMLNYLNNAEKIFLQKTGVLKIDATVTSVPGTVILYDRPANTMDIDRISFNGKPLRRQTSWDLERENRNWRATPNGSPSYWHEDHLANSQFELDKRPAAGGIIRVIADYLPDPYTSISTGNIHLKDSWEPYLRWKVLSQALARDGDNQDLGRSRYAHERFKMGIYLARRIMKGIAELSV
jgi:hypothetical protein